MMKIEYRIKPVTRYLVTRWHHQTTDEGECESGGVDTCGEFENKELAQRIANALWTDDFRLHRGKDCDPNNEVTIAHD